ncbi:MAG: hemolysin III family protein [Bifidobacterium crudilactis]|jgi:hemolysin III|uniref:PAQR family membrane homeostasis protein TrhA n=1 Tax=Bifidobacterium crudilactis TaxID=327277 RepID=UPI003A5C024E
MSTASRPVNSQMPAAKVTASDRLGQIRSSGEVPVTTQISDRIQKPRLRGILHLMAFPVSVIASMVLIALAPSGELKIGASIYALSTMLLFGNSAMLHVGRWGRRMNTILCQIDYANIFIIIAGTNTVFLLTLHTPLRWTYLAIIWSVAFLGSVCHAIWHENHDWLFTTIYVVLGLTAVLLLPLLWNAPNHGHAVTILLAVGGAAYIAGACCFAMRRPNPFPGWFEYHEVFHAGTIVGYVCHAVAAFLAITSAVAA